MTTIKSTLDRYFRRPRTESVDFPTGLEPLVPTDEQASVECHAILIHDVTIGRDAAWKNSTADSEDGWCKCLTDVIPQTRIFAFGYNASTMSDLSDMMNPRTIEKHAEDLLKNLREKLGHQKKPLNDPSTRLAGIQNTSEQSPIPLIIVAHGYGGLIYERMLLNTRSSTDGFLKSGFQLVFLLGTPHYDAGLGEWAIMCAKARNISCAKNAQSQIWTDTLKEFVETTRKGQEQLRRKLKEQDKENPKIEIVGCFASVASGSKPMMSPEWAVMPEFTPIPIGTDHFGMTHLRGQEHDSTTKVAAILKSWNARIQNTNAAKRTDDTRGPAVQSDGARKEDLLKEIEDKHREAEKLDEKSEELNKKAEATRQEAVRESWLHQQYTAPHSRHILELEGQGYELIPVEQSGRQPLKLRRFDDPQLGKIPEYQYKPLKGSHKKIRLLQLKSGAIDSPDVYGELLEADYHTSYQIPTYVEERPNDDRSGKGDGSAEADRSVSKQRIQEQELDELAKLEVEYEALSWCWGKGVAEYVVLIDERNSKHEGKTYKLRVREQLALALKYLRHRDKIRTLWIDAICIDQENPSERNHQLQMMSRIYSRAREVCVWLGDGDSSSKIALDFITKEITDLRNFDTLVDDGQHAEKWKALMMLMQREWFLRRWGVQEIALAKGATIHCGLQSIPWKEFAIAVEVFVRAGDATHRPPKIMQGGARSQHVPGWFQNVSALGASHLVQATGKIFRAQQSSLEEKPYSESQSSEAGTLVSAARMNRLPTIRTIDPLDRRSLLSLEYLVTSLFTFGASEPRDVIYSMLALSRDATPFAISGGDTLRDSNDYDARLIMTTCGPFLQKEPFLVDYQRPYIDVCKDFVDFAIKRKKKVDPSQALDVLCRPWALPPSPVPSIRLPKISRARKVDRIMERRDADERPWKKVKSNSSIRGHKVKDDDLEVDVRSMPDYQAMCEKVHRETTWEHPENFKRIGADVEPKALKIVDFYFPPSGSQAEATAALESQAEQDVPLPSWVGQASRAPLMLGFTPGIDFRITTRSHADPLVGHAHDGQKNYSAAQSQVLRSVEFRKRQLSRHYSLFVEGFVLDDVREVLDASQGGNIPKSWLDMGKWNDQTKDPPDDFWRTLVADRGWDNGNPPSYYARACRESAAKGGIASGRIDTAALINTEHNSIVTEFCRRVHSVIWNRHLFRTTSGRLGLATNVHVGDKVCILYGCTVPVVLCETVKEVGDTEREKQEDCVNSLRRVMRRMEQLRERKAQYHTRKTNDEFPKTWTEEVEQSLRKYNANIREESESGARDSDDSPDDDDTRVEDNARQETTRVRPVETEDSGNQTEEQDSGQTQDDQAQDDSGRDRQLEHSGDTADVDPRPSVRSSTRFKMMQEGARRTDCNKWYVLRGECYLHGMMDGEAIREKLYEEIVDRRFELR